MKKQLFLLLSLLLIHINGTLYAQGKRQAAIDSMLKELPKTKDDTNKVKLLHAIAGKYFGAHPDDAIKYGQQELALAQKIDWKKGIASAYNLIGGNFMAKGEIAHSLDYFQLSLKTYEESGDKEGMAHELKNICVVYVSQGAYPKALEYILKALKINEALGNKENIASDYGIIGGFYTEIGDCSKALEFTLNALAMNKELRDTSSIITNLQNIGSIYGVLKDYTHAMDYYSRSLRLAEISESTPDMSSIYSNMGKVYRSQRNYALALLYEFRSIRYRDVTDIGNIARENGGIGTTYLAIAQDSSVVKQDSLIPADKAANIQKAIGYLKLSVADKDVIDMRSIRDFSLSLSEAYALAGNYKEAFEQYKLSAQAKDSLFSTESNKKIANIEADRDAELKEKKIEVQRLQIASAKNERKYYIAGLGILVLLSGGLFGRYRITRRNKIQLEEKNVLIAREKENADIQRLRAEKSEQAKQQFLANMSHEIRTPMNAMSGMTELLIAKQPRPDQLNYLHVISKSSDILLHIINDILDLSKIAVGKMELENIDFSLSETIQQVTDTLSFRAEEKGLQLVTVIGDGVNDLLIGDPFRLNQILINLGSNAIKFTKKGSVEITARKASSERSASRIVFSVTDTGIGIPPAELLHIFDDFKQVNRSDTRKYGGTGLGLSIAKQLVELHNDNINVESIEGKGTTFSFTIEYAHGSEERLRERISNDQKADGTMLNGLRILLADDNEYNRLVVSETLHLKAEVTIDEAVNGLKAVQLLEKNDYDVVLMDVQMPEMNGFEATEYIRSKLPAPKNKIPVIALTASMLRLDIELCYQHGMNTFVPKPFKSWQLIAAIAEQTGRAQQPFAPKKTAQKSNGPITDLDYLHKFCEGDVERVGKYVEIYLADAAGFEEKLEVATTAKDTTAIAALMHTFKPKWMMMGMKQTVTLSQKIEMLCYTPDSDKTLAEHLSALLIQSNQSIKELEQYG